MYNFFVLGIIPGTNIRINFQVWLITAVVLATTLQLRYLWRNFSIEVVRVAPLRQPLHANRLHQRG